MGQRPPVRLLVLFVVLAGVAAYGVPKIVSDVSAAPASASSCATPPPTTRETLAQLARLTARLRPLLAGRAVEVQGLQEPAGMWTDQPPTGPPRLSGSTTVDAGYEIRWWADDQDHLALDVFHFNSARAASRFVSEAASTRCRRDATAPAVTQPSGGRGLLWTNPDDAREADVLYSRGASAFRLVNVPPLTYLDGAYRLDDQELIGAAEAMACQVASAGCGRLRPLRTLTPGGFDALREIGFAEARLRLTPRAEAPAVIASSCAVIRRSPDAEAILVYQGCQAILHLFADDAAEARCYGSQACARWAASAMAADIHRIGEVIRGLALRLTPGACHGALLAEAAADARLGEGIAAIGRDLAAHDVRAARRAAAGVPRLDRDELRRAVWASGALMTCHPASSAWGLAQLS